MPREQINYASVLTVDSPEESGVALPPGRNIGEPLLNVNWSPASAGGYVQVSMEIEIEYAKLIAETPNGDSATTTLLSSPALRRDELNKLIRALRRARDQAYGRDE